MVSKPKPIREPRGKKRKRKTSRQVLEKRLDDLVSTIVILRDGRCVCCGTSDGLTCGHFVSRGKGRVRFDLQNCNAQCSGCNLRHNQYPQRYTRYIENHYGLGVLHRLQDAEDESYYKWAMSDLLDLESSLLPILERVLSEQTDAARVEWAINRLGNSLRCFPGISK